MYGKEAEKIDDVKDTSFDQGGDLCNDCAQSKQGDTSLEGNENGVFRGHAYIVHRLGCILNSMYTSDDYRNIDFRKHPEKYKVGRGEQGVLLAEPYKSEILPHWRFATPEKAALSADKILELFYEYKKADDFVGMDMARKFLQMGFTRSRRYANHKGGKKYDGPVPDDKKGQSGAHGRAELPRIVEDPDKAESAAIFFKRYEIAKDDPDYLRMKAEHTAAQK